MQDCWSFPCCLSWTLDSLTLGLFDMLNPNLTFKWHINIQLNSLHQNNKPSNRHVFSMKLVKNCRINWFSVFCAITEKNGNYNEIRMSCELFIYFNCSAERNGMLTNFQAKCGQGTDTTFKVTIKPMFIQIPKTKD